MVAIDGMVMQRTSPRGNIHVLQRICVGGNRHVLQRICVDDMIMQCIKFIARMHIATKIIGCLLFYRNTVNLNSSL
jgi:hypothetical protein